MDGNYATKKYPRVTDPVYGDTLPILYEGSRHTITGASYTPTNGKMVLTAGRQYSPTNAAFNPSTGMLTLTVPNHGIPANDKVKIVDNSLTFTCSMDDHSSEHSYPRSTDPKSDDWITAVNVTTNTFDVQVGATPLEHFKPSAATYTPATGDLVLSIGTHTLTVGEGIRLAEDSLIFSCDYNCDGICTQKKYPRASGENGTAGGADNNTGTPDPAYDTSVYITAITSNTTATAGSNYLTNTTSAAFTVTLPASPSAGDTVVVADAGGTWATNNLSVARNGQNIMGSATNLTCNVNGAVVSLIYSGVTCLLYTSPSPRD